MKITGALIIAAAMALSLAANAAAAEKKAMKGMMKSNEPAIKNMSRDEMIKTALSAAPAHISRDATVLVPGEGGKWVEAKKGTNGFTCIPDIDGQETPDPICGDKAATQWLMDAIAKAPKPANTEPGIAYMAMGGWHWEKEGKVTMDMNAPGVERVKEPPHWMILWPFDPKMTMLPGAPGSFGTYVMFDGTPFAHLMIYEDPANIGR